MLGLVGSQHCSGVLVGELRLDIGVDPLIYALILLSEKQRLWEHVLEV